MEAFVLCAGGIAFFAIFFGFFAFMRYLSYKETIALAEKGLVKPQRSNGGGKGALVWGILITAVGLALTLGLWPLGAMFNPDLPFGFGPWMVVGLIPTFFGLALVLIHVLTHEPRQKDEEKPEAGK
jgi:sterol desaturase/sphingolipid hydroxylase (fatty acid hydroxylase superfamily)